eukprot:TRINITY_DN1026_c0_g2_i3.p2 TRINITY_DN1026_c0_g2~~TRINITY_DN1026_c0_g2_i3.p2  ORF type:complete len:187 (+),score=32.67 TRINITY_DN1026_c0_g2_i3:77-637(+)
MCIRDRVSTQSTWDIKYFKGMAESKCAIRVIEEGNFVHVLRIFNSNIKGTVKVGFALGIVKGIGLRLGHVLLKIAKIDPNKRAGELTQDEVNRLNEIVADPQGHNIPVWLYNRKRDRKDGKDSILVSNAWDTKMREDLERMRKIRLHRGLRHIWGLKVRGQHTCSTGRTGSTIGYVRTKQQSFIPI